MRKWVYPIIFFILTLSASCTKPQTAKLPDPRINLSTGIQSLARLGESEAAVLQRTAAWNQKKIPLSSLNQTDMPAFNHVIFFPDFGTRVYFLRGLVALIEVQEPFQGGIVGKELSVFALKPPPGESWRGALIRQFGPPEYEVAGGRLRSRSLFYSWGDVAFNRMGPNELALHRNTKVKQYREKNFGRVIQFFSTKP